MGTLNPTHSLTHSTNACRILRNSPTWKSFELRAIISYLTIHEIRGGARGAIYGLLHCVEIHEKNCDN